MFIGGTCVKITLELVLESNFTVSKRYKQYLAARNDLRKIYSRLDVMVSDSLTEVIMVCLWLENKLSMNGGSIYLFYRSLGLGFRNVWKFNHMNKLIIWLSPDYTSHKRHSRVGIGTEYRKKSFLWMAAVSTYFTGRWKRKVLEMFGNVTRLWINYPFDFQQIR